MVVSGGARAKAHNETGTGVSAHVMSRAPANDVNLLQRFGWTCSLAMRLPGVFEIPSSPRHHADGVGGAITQDSHSMGNEFRPE